MEEGIAVRKQAVFIKRKENNILVKRKDGKSRNWSKRPNIEKNKKIQTMVTEKKWWYYEWEKSNDIKYDGAGLKRVVCIRWIESGICKKKFEPRLDSNTRQLSNKAREWLYRMRRTHKTLKFKQWRQHLYSRSLMMI